MTIRNDYESPLVPEWDQLEIPVEDVEPENAQSEHTKGAEDEDGS